MILSGASSNPPIAGISILGQVKYEESDYGQNMQPANDPRMSWGPKRAWRITRLFEPKINKHLAGLSAFSTTQTLEGTQAVYFPPLGFYQTPLITLYGTARPGSGAMRIPASYVPVNR